MKIDFFAWTTKTANTDGFCSDCQRWLTNLLPGNLFWDHSRMLPEAIVSHQEGRKPTFEDSDYEQCPGSNQECLEPKSILAINSPESTYGGPGYWKCGYSKNWENTLSTQVRWGLAKMPNY